MSVERCFVTGFLDVSLTNSLAICNFKNRQTMRVVISSNCLKFDVDFTNGGKNWEIVCYFVDTSIWIGCAKISLLQKKYLSSGVNVLTNSLKFLHITNRDICQLNFSQMDEKYYKSSVMQISQVLGKYLTWWLSKDFL